MKNFYTVRIALMMTLYLGFFFNGIGQCSSDSVFTEPTFLTADVASQYAFLAADIDSDGDFDIIYSKTTPQSDFGIYIKYNLDGFGTFSSDSLAHLSPNGSITAISIADFDDDGLKDIAYSRPLNEGNVVWLKNHGNGEFSNLIPVGENLSSNLRDMSSNDIDQDGDFDIAVMRGSDDLVTWFENQDGIGQNWIQHDVGIVDDLSCLTVDDFDSDGIVDFIVGASQFSDYIGYFSGLGSGMFSELVIFSEEVDGPTYIIMTDINGDGINDLVAGDNNDDLIYWHPSLGGTLFGDKQIVSSTDAFKQIASHDFDCDGDLDLVSASGVGIILHENVNSGSSWSNHLLADFSPTYYNAELADFDGDIALDIAYSGVVDPEIAWSSNNCDCPIVSGLFETRRVDVTLFPNPTSDNLQLSIPNQEAVESMYIVDHTGRIITEYRMSEIGDQIDVQSLCSGLYTLHLITVNGGVAVQKFIKE